MIAKQYTITLPADYDMGIVRQRVESKGASFDGIAGLTFKAFLIQERGKGGAIANAYAPFYLWSNIEALWSFVAGPGFRGIVESFGWTPIQTWIPLAQWVPQNFSSIGVRSATRLTRSIPAGQDLTVLRQQQTLGANSARDEPNLAARVVAIDIDRWSMISFSLWACDLAELLGTAASHVAVERYEVLHLSVPNLT